MCDIVHHHGHKLQATSCCKVDTECSIPLCAHGCPSCGTHPSQLPSYHPQFCCIVRYNFTFTIRIPTILKLSTKYQHPPTIGRNCTHRRWKSASPCRNWMCWIPRLVFRKKRTNTYARKCAPLPHHQIVHIDCVNVQYSSDSNPYQSSTIGRVPSCCLQTLAI